MAQQATTIEAPRGINQQDWNLIREHIDRHIDARVSEYKDFIPELLAQNQLRVVKDAPMRAKIARVAIIIGAATIGGAIGCAVTYRRMNRKRAEATVEVKEKETGSERARGGMSVRLAA